MVLEGLSGHMAAWGGGGREQKCLSVASLTNHALLYTCYDPCFHGPLGTITGAEHAAACF